MNSDRLEQLAKLISPPEFLGIVQPNALSELAVSGLDTFLVIVCFNKHYTLFVKNSLGCGYFDSLKQTALLENGFFLSFLAANCRGKLLTNSFKTQTVSSYTCGYHVLYFIYLMFITGKDFSFICEKHFSKNVRLNEKRVLRFQKWLHMVYRKPQTISGLRRLAEGTWPLCESFTFKRPFLMLVIGMKRILLCWF